jgi:hypothetical protein
MEKKNIFLVAATAALSLGLIALPGVSKSAQDAPQVAPQEPAAPSAPRTMRRMRIVQAPEAGVAVAPPDEDGNQAFTLAFNDDGGSWLGVETQEVTSAKAKDLKLSAERGVVIGKVLEDSPASKAGLKDGDVIVATDSNEIMEVCQRHGWKAQMTSAAHRSGTEAQTQEAVERRHFAALKDGSDAVDKHREVVKLDPSYRDAEITIGLYDYTVGALPLPVKITAGMFCRSPRNWCSALRRPAFRSCTLAQTPPHCCRP